MTLRHRGMAYPTNAAQLAHMRGQLRRPGHMIERSPRELAPAVHSAQQQTALRGTSAPDLAQS
eukprot:8114091-Pyramimonas_sp.AAC.1